MQTAGANLSGAASRLAGFVHSLVADGRVVVSGRPLAGAEDDVLPMLAELDAAARSELTDDAPDYSAAVALWAARLFYHLCQFVVCRDLGEDRIRAACATPCPEPRGPETDWSADLVFRHLPRLFQLARHLSNADPLVKQLQQLAAAWPLSSVGIPELARLPLESFVMHPGLRRLYADRIVASGDTSRLGEARVDDLLRADFGAHRELAPAISSRLFAGDAAKPPAGTGPSRAVGHSP
jgi:hypothetical protein